MANIMINEICNLKCPYCFANEFVNDEVNGAHRNNITLENFNKAVEFILTERSNERIGIIGGEPTLHPQFTEILERLIFDNRVQTVLIFTNGTYLEKYFKILTHSKIKLLINCNSATDIGELKYNMMLKNIDTMINEYYMKDKITLGINMYKENFEYGYILELIDKYDFKSVRTSIAVPNTDDKKEFNMLEYFRRMKPSVFNFFSELEKRGVVPTYDCNLMPTCVTTPEEKSWLNRFLDFEKYCNVRSNINDCSFCSPVIDILPDLNAVRCFGLSRNHKVPIYKFKNLNDLRNYFYNIFDTHAFNVLSSNECEICELRQTMKCTGACLAFKVSKIEKAEEYSNLL